MVELLHMIHFILKMISQQPNLCVSVVAGAVVCSGFASPERLWM